MTIWRGQDQAITALSGALDSNRLHHAWLFGGPTGVGKGGIARDFAKRLLGARGGAGTNDLRPDPGEQVTRLAEAGTHPDLVILERLIKDAKKGETPSLARNITVEQIRGLSRFLHLAPSMARRRIVIIDAADDMERGAANALLKNLEEPPRDTIFVLIAHAPGRLLPTIRSRCRFLNFRALAAQDMNDALAEAAPDLEAQERETLIRGAEGSPGRALGMRGYDLPALEAALNRIAETGDSSNAERIALARSLAPKAAQARYEGFLDFVPHYIARRLRRDHKDGDRADLWGEAEQLGRGAITLSLDPTATIMALCGTVARLAPGHKL